MKNKVLKMILAILFIYFLIILVSSQTGYYEYNNNLKATYTEEKIKEFEKDVMEGKNVNIKDYITNDKKDYTNKITDVGAKMSNIVIKSVNLALKESYKIIEKLVN